MWRALAVWIFLLNTSTTTLYNTMLVVDDEVVKVGTLRENEGCELDIEKGDSIRVIFTLGQEREGWLGTDVKPFGDIVVSDTTEIFELDIEIFE